ncbi:prothoracicostatic peptides-like isoform X1 [Pollicipes pollicipes]|uniref:prothoracicostatic peptides-like isoform X1 n=1 Tax=Pollicipes pollicipes TaxID=41117 RepID=UPI0018849935|nr:prothoracicostatic peptides-like isoform X1 [Pollicipes pollicipes]
MESRCLLLTCLALLAVRPSRGEQPEPVSTDKRADWNDLHGNWGKRQPAPVEDDADSDALLREVATGLVLSGYSAPEDKRRWNNFAGSWGKRAWNNFDGSWGKRGKWNNFGGSWGKRSKWNSMGPSWGKRAKWDNFGGSWGKRNNWDNFDGSWGKRAKWDNLGGSWGKRAKWDNFGGSWGKRTDWDNFNGAWGKRKGWDSFSGGWGKRAAWNNLGGSWGKRNVLLPELQDGSDASDNLQHFISANYKVSQPKSTAASDQLQAKKRKDWTQLSGAWGKRSADKTA